jgi:hypothetical protein
LGIDTLSISVWLVSTVTNGGVTVGDAARELAAQFPGWRIWQSRPNGLWWATRRGNVQYHHEPRRPGWGITIGGVGTLGELAAQLATQRHLDDPEPLPIPDDAP